MRNFFAMSCLTIMMLWLACDVSAQGVGAGKSESNGLKDAYKEYFTIGVAVNMRNVSNTEHCVD